MKKEIPWWRKPLSEFDPRTSKSEEERSLRRGSQMLRVIPGLLQLPYWYQVIVGDRNWLSWWDGLLDLDLVAWMMVASVISLLVLLPILKKMEKKRVEIINKEEEKDAKEKEKEKWEKLSRKAQRREAALDYDSAIQIWEELGEIEEAARIRELKAEQGAVKVTQKVVHGDEVSKTEIKDSVLNRSNVGGGSSKMQELEKLTEMKEKGLISDEEYEKMKREIIG